MGSVRRNGTVVAAYTWWSGEGVYVEMFALTNDDGRAAYRMVLPACNGTGNYSLGGATWKTAADDGKAWGCYFKSVRGSLVPYKWLARQRMGRVVINPAWASVDDQCTPWGTLHMQIPAGKRHSRFQPYLTDLRTIGKVSDRSFIMVLSRRRWQADHSGFCGRARCDIGPLECYTNPWEAGEIWGGRFVARVLRNFQLRRARSVQSGTHYSGSSAASTNTHTDTQTRAHIRWRALAEVRLCGGKCRSGLLLCRQWMAANGTT